MWIKPRCSECGTGEYAQLRPTAHFHCTNDACEHLVEPADFIDIEDWKLEDGIVSVLVTSWL
jgi:hypothetical protein